jgi:hypothetical protein
MKSPDGDVQIQFCFRYKSWHVKFFNTNLYENNTTHLARVPACNALLKLLLKLRLLPENIRISGCYTYMMIVQLSMYTKDS